MRVGLAALVFGLSSASALAATCPNALPPNTTAPASIGKAHVCSNYPQLALRLGEQGAANLGFMIGKDGRVHNPRILRSSGFADLDEAAIACASQFLYIAAKRNGKPVDVPWQVRIAYCMVGGCPPQSVQFQRGKPPPPPQRRELKKTKTPRNCVPIASRSRSLPV